jgi:uncharacterized protein (TIGR03437 family)
VALHVRLRGRVRLGLFLIFSGAAVWLAPRVCLAQATQFNINTVAGSNVQGYKGDGGPPTSAQLNSPAAMALDSSGNLLIADRANNCIRKISGGKINSFAGICAAVGAYGGDGGSAASANFNAPTAMAFDRNGNLYVSDLLNHVVRKITPSGTISTFAGTGQYVFNGDNGPATDTDLNQPFGLAVDANNNVYIADSQNHCVRVVTPDGNIRAVAGVPAASGYSGDGGPARQAKLNQPLAIALDNAGNLYIADTGNNVIRMVTTDGNITTIAGNHTAGFGGDGGPATSGQINKPEGLAVDAAGAVYITDFFNNRVRQVVNGIINTVAGVEFSGYTGDNGPATNARLYEPIGLFVDNSSGNVYIADYGNDVVRELTPNAPSVAAGGVISAGAFGAFSSAAPGSWIEIYGTNLAVSRRQWATADFSGSTAPTSLDGTSVTIGGQPAFVDYISGGQVNVQVPSNVQTGSQPLVVKNAAGSSSSYSLTVNATQPGLLSQYNVGGVQYLTAVLPGNTFVMPASSVAGLTSRPAKAGETITLYGVGFGPVTPAVAAGQIAPQQSYSLNGQFQISIGGTPAVVTYAGLTPGAVGLYQFNVVVPSVAPGNAVPVTFSLSGQAGTQTLYTAIQ